MGLLKRSRGMSVKELASALKMSYMGVKQHCDALKKNGYLDTWRRPKGTGRPEKIYRAAPKLDEVLPCWSNELSLGLLAQMAHSYGEAMPDRLLYGFLQQKVEGWGARIKGVTIKDRLQELVKHRNLDGWMSDFCDDELGVRIVDHHSPLNGVAKLYPNVWDLESRVLSTFLGCPVERKIDGTRMEFCLTL
ncbi:MAG: hypothetical protein RL693_319 [Verrucomicrobiota bacterium]